MRILSLVLPNKRVRVVRAKQRGQGSCHYRTHWKALPVDRADLCIKNRHHQRCPSVLRRCSTMSMPCLTLAGECINQYERTLKICRNVLSNVPLFSYDTALMIDTALHLLCHKHIFSNHTHWSQYCLIVESAAIVSLQVHRTCRASSRGDGWLFARFHFLTLAYVGSQTSITSPHEVTYGFSDPK